MRRQSMLLQVAICAIVSGFIVGCPGASSNEGGDGPSDDGSDTSTNGVTPGDGGEIDGGTANDVETNGLAAGAAVFADNGCASCHGADGGGGLASAIRGATVELLNTNLREPPVTHAGGKYPGLTDTELADLAAFLATDDPASGDGQGVPPSDHTVPKGAAGTLHRSGFLDPATNCAGCHGANLQGVGSAPSCTQCHGELWNGEVSALHTDTLTRGSVVADHAPGRAGPAANCARCHGTDLFGSGDAPACWNCHGSIWDGVPDYPPTHTRQKDGFAHGPGLESPLGDCDACHGADLRGTPLIPSCFSCHGAEWNEEEDD